MIERSIQGLLPAFFSQLMIGDALNGYATPSWVRQIQNSGDTIRPCIPLDNDESSIMEIVMTELRMHDKEGYQILKLYWGHGWSDAQIARSFVPKVSRAEIEQMRRFTENKLEARIGLVNEQNTAAY